MADDGDEQLASMLAAARAGEDGAVARLCDALYDDLRRVARSRLRSHQSFTLLDTTALVHESFLRLSRTGRLDVGDRNHFLGYAANVMRSVIVAFVRERMTERRGGHIPHVSLNEEVVAEVADVANADEALIMRIHGLLEELTSVDARLVRVVEMRYFAGMREKDIADVLNVTERTVRRDWEKARLLLRVRLQEPESS